VSSPSIRPAAWSTNSEAVQRFLDHLAEVDGVRRQGRRITVTGHGALLASVAAALVNHGLKPIDLASHRPSLEDVFLMITGEEH
jgi:hypothetical protein